MSEKRRLTELYRLYQKRTQLQSAIRLLETYARAARLQEDGTVRPACRHDRQC